MDAQAALLLVFLCALWGFNQVTIKLAITGISPLMQAGVPGMGLSVADERYFWYHHSDADTLDKLDPDDVARCVATLAVMAFVVADLPDPLPR